MRLTVRSALNGDFDLNLGTLSYLACLTRALALQRDARRIPPFRAPTPFDISDDG